MLLGILSIFNFLFFTFITPWLIINGRRIKYLSSVQSFESISPSVIIIIAVRNEEYALKEALVSVCNLSYSNYKVLVINDRSTDNSAKILQELAAEYHQLSVINIDTLPPGWLGKNHALYVGSISSTQEYILFTDADVLFDKYVLNKAMAYCVSNNLDHLAILPGIISSSSLLKSVILTFIIMLTALQRPWAAKIKTSKASMGVGAFNLVKRKAYELSGTHKAIAMRPDDDLKLAAQIKVSGGAADVLYGVPQLQVEWYSNVKEFINGLMKNVFSGFDYNIFKALGGASAVLAVLILPLPLMLIFGSLAQRILAAYLFLLHAILYGKMPGAKGKWWYAFTGVYAGFIIVYVILKSAIITLRNGGIYWRDTFYSLKELRKYI